MTNIELGQNPGLLAWQWASYRTAHADRRNLVVHVLTVPLFMTGTVAVLAAPFVSGWLAVAGVVGMFTAMAAQGRGHSLEASPPVAFRGPLDVVARIFVEQWITFPRFVLSGELGRALRG